MTEVARRKPVTVKTIQQNLRGEEEEEEDELAELDARIKYVTHSPS